MSARGVAYECTMINAELHAAQAIGDYARMCMTEATGTEHGAKIESRLAGAFVAEILTKLRPRFKKIRFATELPTKGWASRSSRRQ